MSRGFYLCLITALLAVLSFACSGDTTDPVTVPVAPGLSAEDADVPISNTHLWGYYLVSIDPDDGTASAIPCRKSMFTANVVNFINSNPCLLYTSDAADE